MIRKIENPMIQKMGNHMIKKNGSIGNHGSNEPVCPVILKKICLFNYLGFQNGKLYDNENGVRLE